MCGIYCALSCDGHILPDNDLEHRLRKRGPDSFRTIKTAYAKSSTRGDDRSARPVNICLCSTVLGLRGSVTVQQPFQGEGDDFTLCWNGEAWQIGRQGTYGNDTESVYRVLVAASTSRGLTEEPIRAAERISEALSSVSGPYSFVFWDRARGLLFFGRDFLGRRSLLWTKTNARDFIVSSVSNGGSELEWQEVEANGVYCIDLNTVGDEQADQGAHFPTCLAPYRFAEPGQPDHNSTVIPRLSLSKELPVQQSPINEESPSTTKLHSLLQDSMRLRVLGIPDPPLFTEFTTRPPARLGILFSGGLDCTVLARLSHDLLQISEPIDLLNVAFENPRVHKTGRGQGTPTLDIYETCPDRATGRSSLAELQRICPDREWRFVQINVPYEETLRQKPTVVSLMYPHNTEMDLSIAYALYFAAQGSGLLQSGKGTDPVPYTTNARVLLSGLGADEIFAGYTRHATAFRHRGFDGLLEELELDVSRLGKRNLGRDDRVLSHWSREVRFPYLDEELLTWALSTPVTEKCGFSEITNNNDTGPSVALEPGKKVLRCLAWKLGMTGVAKEKKRAIQFGARTAKMETGKTKGTTLIS